MTAPEPTAVERTIAETLARAYFEGLGWDWGALSVAERLHCTLDFEAVVAAIRNLPPEQMAQLIGGEVQSDGGIDPWVGDVLPETSRRAVGPWREVTGSATPARDLTPGARDDPLTLAEEQMCPNCITPWKCNGPHEASRSWDEGYQAGYLDGHFEEAQENRARNPYSGEVRDV